MEIRLVGVTLIHADRRTGGRAGGRTDRQTGRQTDRQTEGEMYVTK